MCYNVNVKYKCKPLTLDLPVHEDHEGKKHDRGVGHVKNMQDFQRPKIFGITLLPCMPTLPDYLGVSRIQNESPVRATKSPG